jgi:hypothetical protein
MAGTKVTGGVITGGDGVDGGGSDDVISGAESIKMPKRGVNWAFLKINCKN